MEDSDTEDAPAALTYELTLDGGGMSFKRTVPEDVALSIIAAVMGGTRTSVVVPAPPARATASAGGNVHTSVTEQSLREYLNETQAQRNVDKILAIALYLTDHRGVGEFDPNDVKREFRTASELVPGNFPRDFRWAVGAGWLAKKSDERGRYYVTDTGRKAVEARFPKDVKQSTGVNKAIRRRRPRGKGGDA